MDFSAGLTKTLSDGISQFGRGYQKISHLHLSIFPSIPGPFAIIVGVMVVVLDPVVQKLDKFI